MKKFIFTIAALVFGLSQMTAQKMIFPEVIEVPQGGSAPLTITYETGGKVITTYMFNFVLPDGLTLAQGDAGMDWKQDANNKGFTPMPNGTTGLACLSSNVGSIYLKGTEGTLGSVDLEAAKSLSVGKELEVKATQLAFSEYVGGNYETINFDDVVIKVKIVENRITLDETVGVTDETPTGTQNVRVNRTIKAGNWNTICLPFAMTADQVKTAFGDGVKLADFIGCEGDGNQNTASTSIKVKFNAVDAIEANHPYLIKVEEALTSFTADEVTISPDEENAIVQKDKTSRPVAYNSFVGTYNPSTIIPIGCLFLNSNKFYYSNGNSKLKAFRAYFDFGVNWLEEAPYAESKISISVDDDATSIDGIGYQRITEGVYDLSGRKIQLKDGDLNKLQKGVYIIDGKKVTIK